MGFKIPFALIALTLVGAGSIAESKEGLRPASVLCANPGQKPARRRPGRPVDEYQLPPCEDGREGIEPWIDPFDLGPPVPDRWRIIEAAGVSTNLWDPYNGHNPLKGDIPMWGEDWFYSIIAISDTIIEPRRFPLPVGGATTLRSGSLDTIGRGETTIFATNLILENVIYKGDTIFKPPDWEFRFTPVFNINQVHADEKGILNVDPDRSSEKRRDTFCGIHAVFQPVLVGCFKVEGACPIGRCSMSHCLLRGGYRKRRSLR